jgi:hypothetical protein
MLGDLLFYESLSQNLVKAHGLKTIYAFSLVHLSLTQFAVFIQIVKSENDELQKEL